MKTTFQSFFSNFYGKIFIRHFRRIPDIDQPKIYKQFIVQNPKELYQHVHRNSGFHSCFISIYDNGSINSLKSKHKSNLIFDRVFFDFDTRNQEAEKIKTQLITLRKKGPCHEKDKQADLKQQLQNLIIKNEIAKDAIDDAKKFSLIFQRDFGKSPALFFSGFKGCHAYVFFEPFEPTGSNRTVHYFAENVKNHYGLSTLDLSVNKDALSRMSRIPYSKHQLTDLTVVPFAITDSYYEIVKNAQNTKIQSFNVQNHLTEFGKHLKNIDTILTHNANIKPISKFSNVNSFPVSFKNSDNRLIFKKIIGEPVKEYEHYNMYHCPFLNHQDIKPSFMVHSNGYKCYGCSRKGNYWQFLKDYNGWDDTRVKEYLRNSNSE